MTNREKLLNTNIYDLLKAMNKFIIQNGCYGPCVIEALEQKHIACPYNRCEECIQNYLNKEV